MSISSSLAALKEKLHLPSLPSVKKDSTTTTAAANAPQSTTPNYSSGPQILYDESVTKIKEKQKETKQKYPAIDLISNVEPGDSAKLRVKLENTSLRGREEGIVEFIVMPTIAESQSATYESFSPIHHPGEILKYKSTTARTWAIQSKLVSRTPQEAADNLRIISNIRAWVMPYYGFGTATDVYLRGGDSTFSEKLGAPPPILRLTAYGSRMIGPVFTVIESFNWTWPNDCDYIEVENYDRSKTPFPVILDISVNLKETWSPAEFSGFNLRQYYAGDLRKSFKSASDLINARNAASTVESIVGPAPAQPSVATQARTEPVVASGAASRAANDQPLVTQVQQPSPMVKSYPVSTDPNDAQRE